MHKMLSGKIELGPKNSFHLSDFASKQFITVDYLFICFGLACKVTGRWAHIETQIGGAAGPTWAAAALVIECTLA